MNNGCQHVTLSWLFEGSTCVATRRLHDGFQLCRVWLGYNRPSSMTRARPAKAGGTVQLFIRALVPQHRTLVVMQSKGPDGRATGDPESKDAERCLSRSHDLEDDGALTLSKFGLDWVVIISPSYCPNPRRKWRATR